MGLVTDVVATSRIFFRGVIQICVEEVDKELLVNNFFFILIIMIILMRSFVTYDPKEDFFKSTQVLLNNKS